MRWAFIVLVAFLVIAGCSKAVEMPEPEPQSNPAEQAAKQETAPVSEPKLPKVSISPEVAALIGKTSKVKSYSYLYHGPPNDALGIGFAVAGTKGKVSLAKKEKLSDGNYYDTVFLNLREKAAKAYCLSPDCTVEGPLQVEFDDYYKTTPFDFLANLTSGSVSGTELLDNRKVSIVQYNDTLGMGGKMWIDNTYGLPIKVIFGKVKHEYRSFYFNTVTEEEVSK